MEGDLYEDVEAGKLTKGDYVMIGDKPCRVFKVSKAKPGKHGSAKAIITAVGIIDNKKVEKTYPTYESLKAPKLKRTEYFCNYMDDEGYLQLQMDSGEMKEDVKLSEQEQMKEVNDNIKKFLEEEKDILVTVLEVVGQEIPCAVREDNTEI